MSDDMMGNDMSAKSGGTGSDAGIDPVPTAPRDHQAASGDLLDQPALPQRVAEDAPPPSQAPMFSNLNEEAPPSVPAPALPTATDRPNGLPVPRPAASSPTSYDCARARRDVERIMCDHPQLAMLERRMARLYGELRRRATPDMAETLVDEQREWLRDHAACEADDDPVGCVRGSLASRIARLQTSE